MLFRVCIVMVSFSFYVFFVFFFNGTATTEIYTLSLHDALPICDSVSPETRRKLQDSLILVHGGMAQNVGPIRSEEHTSELQSRQYLVCRLLLEKKKRPDRRHVSHNLYLTALACKRRHPTPLAAT